MSPRSDFSNDPRGIRTLCSWRAATQLAPSYRPSGGLDLRARFSERQTAPAAMSEAELLVIQVRDNWEDR